MNLSAIIQARAGSTRLPRKVLMDLAGKPMLTRVIERARRVPGVAEVVVATTTLPGDDVVAACAHDSGARVVRGPSDDVLARYHLAIQDSACDAVLRITADCPLLDPVVTGRVVAAFTAGGCDYASNTLERTFPRGLDSEVLSRAALDTAHREATEAPDREHVTCFVWRQPTRFRLRSVADPVDRSGLRWTVDTPEDFALVDRIYAALQPATPDFAYADVLALLDRHADWSALNAHVEQKKTGI